MRTDSFLSELIQKMVKSNSLIAVGAVGLSPTVSCAQQMKGEAHPSPSAGLSFPDTKKVPIYCWVDSHSFLWSDGEAQPRTHNLLATSCTIAKSP